MFKEIDFEELMGNNLKEEFIAPGNTSKGFINRDGHFYHVTSHSFNDDKIYNFVTATYRHNMLTQIASKNGVLIILDVIKPTHSHELLMAKSFNQISNVMKIVNTKVAHFIRTEKPNKYAIKGMRVFRERPAYQVVESYSHLLYLFKYFYENCSELEKTGKQMPYNCFEQIKKGYIKGYHPDLIETLCNLSYEDIMHKCKTMNKNEFFEFCKEYYKDISPEKERKMFFSK